MLLILLVIPIVLGIAGLFLSKGFITWKEFLAHEAVVALVVSIGYGISIWRATADTEIWSGVVARKWQGTEGCCHSYPCNPHPCMCDKNGCSTCWDTCYSHTHDITWNALTSNGETAFYDGCNGPGSSAPGRWSAIQIGEPTAIEHSYTNYIKGNPDSILRRQGLVNKYKGKLPNYPRVFDWYRANRIVSVGVNIPNLAELNEHLAAMNGELGASKQVSLIFVLVSDPSENYLEALREYWLGGKKNDVVVVIGAPNYPEITWAGVLSWTKREDLKVDVRNLLLDGKKFDYGAMLAVGREIYTKFERRHMKDFEYLKSTVEPSTGVSWFLFVLGLLVNLGLQYYFWVADPFGDDYKRRRRF